MTFSRHSRVSPVSTLTASLSLVLAVGACSSSTSPSTGGGDAGNGQSVGTEPVDSGGSNLGSSGDAGSSSVPPSSNDAGATSAGGDASVPPLPANDAQLVLTVPASFTGTTRELDVVVTPTLPIAGPPAGILYQAESPVLTAGQSLTIHGDATGISGSYYVVAVLYMQGGGEFSPTPGKDYEAQSSSTAKFDGAAIDLGTMALTLAGSDGGM